ARRYLSNRLTGVKCVEKCTDHLDGPWSLAHLAKMLQIWSDQRLYRLPTTKRVRCNAFGALGIALAVVIRRRPLAVVSDFDKSPSCSLLVWPEDSGASPSHRDLLSEMRSA